MSDLKIYESKNLIAAMEERASDYRKLKEQLEPLKKAFRKIVNLTDFQGKAADAIKGFYQAQIDVVDAWECFLDTYIAFLDDTERAAEELNLSGNTVVQVPFLQEVLWKTDRKSNDIVSEEEETLTRIFYKIDDLISLNVFSREAVDQKMHQAEKERKDTIEKVHQLDRHLVKEYQVSETQENYALQLFMQLMESSRKNGAISPIYFDSEAYHNSEIYQLKDEVEKRAKEYLAFKEKQDLSWREARAEEEKQKRPWYEKVWSGVLIGSGNAVEDAVEGLKAIADIRKMVSDPVNTLKSGYQSALYMPKYIWSAVTAAWDRDVVRGDAESGTAFFTYGVGG